MKVSSRFQFTVATCVLLLLSQFSHSQQEEITYYHFDALGSPVLATDEAGAVKWREEYAPYGGRMLEQSREKDCSVDPCEPINSPWENRNFYTGKYDEADAGITYFGARWYDPSLGRFLSVDPVEFQENNVFSFNRYAYANNNPYVYVDPDGNIAFLAVLAIGYAAFEVASTAYDVYSAVNTLADNTAGTGNKLLSVGTVAAGIWLPGPGRAYGEAANKAKKTYYSKKKRLDAHTRADGNCEYCGKPTQTERPFQPDSAEGDHYIPQSRGGQTTQENLVNSCRECNGPGGKGGKLPGTEWQPKNPNNRIKDKLGGD